jgi:hypothetical protein
MNTTDHVLVVVLSFPAVLLIREGGRSWREIYCDDCCHLGDEGLDDARATSNGYPMTGAGWRRVPSFLSVMINTDHVLVVVLPLLPVLLIRAGRRCWRIVYFCDCCHQGDEGLDDARATSKGSAMTGAGWWRIHSSLSIMISTNHVLDVVLPFLTVLLVREGGRCWRAGFWHAIFHEDNWHLFREVPGASADVAACHLTCVDPPIFPCLHSPNFESHQNGFMMETAVVRRIMLLAERFMTIQGMS